MVVVYGANCFTCSVDYVRSNPESERSLQVPGNSGVFESETFLKVVLFTLDSSLPEQQTIKYCHGFTHTKNASWR